QAVRIRQFGVDTTVARALLGRMGARSTVAERRLTKTDLRLLRDRRCRLVRVEHHAFETADIDDLIRGVEIEVGEQRLGLLLGQATLVESRTGKHRLELEQFIRSELRQRPTTLFGV